MATPAAETLPAPASRPELHKLGQWLRPAPGRLEFALRLAAVCTLAAGVSEWFQLPEAALTAYVGFFLLRADRATSVALSVALLVLVTVLIGVVLLLSQAVIGRPAVLLAAMTLIAFGMFFLASASKLAPVGGILAMIPAFALSLLGPLPSGELATRALLYVWLAVAIPAGVSIALNLLVAPAPRRLAGRAMAHRLRAAAVVLRAPGTDSRAELQALRHEGTAGIAGWLRLAALEHGSPPRDLLALRSACDATARVLLLVEVLDGALTAPAARASVAETLEGMAEILEAGGYPVDVDLPVIASGLPAPAGQAVAALRSTLAHFADAVPAPPDPDPSAGFFATDAFGSPRHVRFALKATGAAMACYLLYTALDWPGIHTAFITCFIVALGTTGETVEKLSLRIAGCLVGAAAGVATLLWVLPGVDGLGGLLALLFVVTLGATWVAAGSPRIAYAGFQIAFAFYLCVLQGSGPSFDLVVARDRVIGILLGNAVVYLVFTRLWPVSVAPRIDTALAALVHRLARMSEAPDTRQAAIQAARADAACGAIAGDLALLGYEPAGIHPGGPWTAQRARTLHSAGALIAPLALQTGEPRLPVALDALAHRIAAPADAAPAPAPLAALPPWLAPRLQALADCVHDQAASPATLAATPSHATP
ncbi:MAG: FUSC family protein [Pseudomonadota bacterium]|nr:FUSC family protein [Pseudomonadota bacterium]